jgi:multiple sugar transport system substrate-binding protein
MSSPAAPPASEKRPRPSRRRARIGAGAALVTATLLLSACGAGADVNTGGVACDIEMPEEATTVNLLSYNSPSTDPFANAVANGCTADELTVNAPATDFAGQNQRAIQSMSGSSASYDIIEVYGTVYPLYADREWIAPLDEFIADRGDELEIDDIPASLMEQLQYGGEQVGIPTFWGTIIFVYRQDIFDDLGLEPPTTYAEMISAAETITAETGMAEPLALPFNPAGDVSTAYNQILTSLGGTWFEGDTSVPALDSPESIQALEELVTLYGAMSEEALTFSSPEVITQLQTGQAAMSMLYSGRMSALLDAEQTEYSEDFGFAVPPSVEEGGAYASSVSVDGLAIAENSSVDKDLLFDLIGVATGKAASAEAAGSTIPSRTTEAQDADLPFEPAAREVLEADQQLGLPHVPWMSDVYSVMAPIFGSVVTGEITPEEGAAQAQAAAETAIATAGY